MVGALKNAQTLRFQRLCRIHVELVFSEVYLASVLLYKRDCNIFVHEKRQRHVQHPTACAFSNARPIRFCYLDHDPNKPRHFLFNGAKLKRKQILFIIVIRVVARICCFYLTVKWASSLRIFTEKRPANFNRVINYFLLAFKVTIFLQSFCTGYMYIAVNCYGL